MEMTGRVRVAKLSMDQNPATASRFGVRSISGGREVDRLIGVRPEMARRLQRLLT